MRSHSSTVALRVFLLGAMGALGCGGSAASEGDGSGTTPAASPPDGTTGDERDPTEHTDDVSKAGLGGCTHPRPLMAVDTGIFLCGEGYLHRAEARLCPSELPRNERISIPSPPVDAGLLPDGVGPSYPCATDTDCEDPLARCQVIQTNALGPCSFGPGSVVEPEFDTICIRGCREDSDCRNGRVCVCGSPIGECKPVSAVAGCRSDADCEGGAQCLSNARTDNYGEFTFACELPADGCNRDADCANSSFCEMGEPGRSCQARSVCGRPFIVASKARLAPARSTHGWLSRDSAESGHNAPMTRSVSPEVARRLAQHWTEIGLMEHASIAAFARFTLQLLGMGAPLELIEASNRAQADEARHARLAFELATAYAHAPVGPGPLSLAGPLLDADWEAILLTTIEEGCVGETGAAIEAALSADFCTDPAVAQILRGIAEDEARHAALAWRTVQWMLTARPSLKTIARRAFSEAAKRTSTSTSAVGLTPRSPAEEHGALEPSTQAACRQRSIREVVLPCAEQLLEAERIARRTPPIRSNVG